MSLPIVVHSDTNGARKTSTHFCHWS